MVADSQTNSAPHSQIRALTFSFWIALGSVRPWDPIVLLVKDQEIALWLTQGLGAGAAIVGKLALDDGNLLITLNCIRVENAERIGSLSSSFSRPDSSQDSLVKNVDSDSEIAAISRARGVSGGSYTSCLYCPNPQFSSEASKKTQGTVLLSVVVGANRRARDIKVLQPLGDGVTVNAIQAIQEWRIRPADSPDGTSGDVRMDIEVSFRRY